MWVFFCQSAVYKKRYPLGVSKMASQSQKSALSRQNFQSELLLKYQDKERGGLLPPLSSFCFAHWHCSRIGLKDACTLFIKRERPQRRPQRTTALRPRGRGRAEDGNKEALRHACAWPRGRTWPRPRPTRRTHPAGADVAGGTFLLP